MQLVGRGTEAYVIVLLRANETKFMILRKSVTEIATRNLDRVQK